MRNRFALKEHHATRVHYDLRLEVDNVAISWAIPKGISMNPAEFRLAISVPDHPLKSMDFEGTRRKGLYGAGEVLTWDKGEYEAFFQDRETLILTLFGAKLRGKFVMRKKPGANPDWFIRKLEDEYSDPGYVHVMLLKPRKHKGFEPLFELLHD